MISTPPVGRPFLTASWRDLVVVNYKIDPELLTPYLPQGTILDTWQGECFCSVIGFRFLDTRLKGVSIPNHINFEEVNLRFYVRRELHGKDGPETRRGVVFIRELVPKKAIAMVARILYNEKYSAVPMSHSVEESLSGRILSYSWQVRGGHNSVVAHTSGEPVPIIESSESEFILEHYWGYSSGRFGQTIEYQIHHPRWRIWPEATVSIELDVEKTYGPQFFETLNRPFHSAFVAEGSSVTVFSGRRLNGVNPLESAAR